MCLKLPKTFFPFGVKNKYKCLQTCPSGKPYYYKNEKTSDDKYYTCTSKFKCGHESFSAKKYYCENESKNVKIFTIPKYKEIHCTCGIY